MKISFTIGWLVAAFAIANFAYAQTDKDDAAIRAALQAQAAAWNNGDLEGFMSYYLRSEQLKFVSKNGVQYGWQPLYERYRKNYPGKEGMGELRFEIIENERLAAGVFQTIGRWELTRTASGGNLETLGGYFTLTWRKIKGKWLITSDHTS